MFEKFSILDIDSSGSGGEYTVQVRINVYILIFTWLKDVIYRWDLAGRMVSFCGPPVTMERSLLHPSVLIYWMHRMHRRLAQRTLVQDYWSDFHS